MKRIFLTGLIALFAAVACSSGDKADPEVPFTHGGNKDNTENTGDNTGDNTGGNTGGNTGDNTGSTPQTTYYEFTAQPSSLHFSAEGGSQTIQLTTEADWKAYCLDDWVTLTPSVGRGSEPTTITITVTENTDTEYARRSTISFVAQGTGAKGDLDFDVTQDKAEAPAPPQGELNVKVYTGAASGITSTSAKITCNYSGAPEGGVYDRGIYYGTSSSNLNQEAALSSSTSTSAYFTVTLSSLEPNTTYYYKAFVTVWDASQNKYVDFFGSVQSFTTADGGQAATGLQYLGGYEIPAIALKDQSKCNSSGTEKYGSTKWYNYLTTNDNQMVVTHTYKYNGKQYRNYTCLVDKTKKAPLWSAFVMHKDAYPDNNVGRTGSWTEDPGIPGSWQQSSSTSGYSRGHFVASNYRQAVGDANKQTFYMTNQALQQQNGFNGSLWASLEQDVVSKAPSGRDTLYVVVGVLYEDNKTLGGVPCPSHFYKLLMKCSFNTSGEMTAAKGCAYLFTNVAHTGNYSQGLTSIDAVEQRSGWDFFTHVPKTLQDAAEKQSSSVW